MISAEIHIRVTPAMIKDNINTSTGALISP